MDEKKDAAPIEVAANEVMDAAELLKTAVTRWMSIASDAATTVKTLENQNKALANKLAETEARLKRVMEAIR